MAGSWKLVALPLAGALALGGCATKGQLRQVEARLRTEVEQERAARASADEQQAAQLQQLRADLQAMRTEFDAKIVSLENGLQFALPVHFTYDDATVRQEDVAALDRFAEIIGKYYQGSVITVEGFADPAGSRAYNVTLSTNRAEAVREHLSGRGIQAQLRTIGYGEDRLVTPGAEKDDPGAELNRRVVFVVESKTGPTLTTMAVERN
jgi:peptidoglycan-associated lipoprotein